MPDALTFKAGLDAKNFQAGLQQIERMAGQTGRRLGGSVGGGTTAGFRTGMGSLTGHGGRGGVIGEAVVLMREIGRGNWSRIPGSFTILAQRMGILKYIIKDTALASEQFSEAWDKMTAKARATAFLRTVKIGDEQAATMTRNAAAMTVLGDKYRKIAEAEREVAATGPTVVSSLGVIGTSVAAVAIVAYEGYKIWQLYKEKLDEVSKIAVTPFHPEYVTKKNLSANSSLELQKEINEEVRKSVAHYNEVEAAASRVAAVTKEHYEHLRKMNDLSSGSESSKLRERLRLDIEERAAEVRNKVTEGIHLGVEAYKKEREALGIKVTTKPEDEQRLKQLKHNADEAQKFLDGLHKAHGGFGDWYLRSYDLMGTATSEKAKAEAQAVETAKKNIAQYHAGAEAIDVNEETRKQRADLVKQALADYKKAAEIGTSEADLKKVMSQKNKDETDETEAAIAKIRGNVKGYGLNAMQRIGAYAATPPDWKNLMNDVHAIRRQTAHLGSHEWPIPGNGVSHGSVFQKGHRP